ncbi:MAG: resistance nodulation cell division drug efflux pump, component [Rhizobium sp.]|nr:resistance nodulation cell division drug efflux pump, component [Rhizobium sp.]
MLHCTLSSARHVIGSNWNRDMEIDLSSPEDPKINKAGKGRKLVIVLIGSVALGAALLFFWPPTTGQTALPAPKAHPTPVGTASVTTQDLKIERSGLGNVTPLTAVDVKVRVDGQLQRVAFAEGKNVRTGDLIALIDPRPYQAALDQALATLRKDMAQLDSAKIEDARAKSLVPIRGITMQLAEAAAAQVAIMEATVAGDQAAVDTARLNLSFATITAPISGRAGLRQAEQGAIVHASDAAGLVTITQMQPIAVQFSLPQEELPDLVAGQAKGALPVAIDSQDGAKHLADGKLAVIDSQVDTSTGMVKLKAVFPNEDLALWPGELVSARITLKTDQGLTVVPSPAVQNGQTGQYVFVVKPDNKVASVSVATGPSMSGMTAILKGLNPGETVVVSGQSRLTEEAVVAPRPIEAQNLASTEGQIQ